MGAFTQSVPTSTAKKQTLTLFSYAGGLDNVSSHTTANDDCATEVLNMEFLEDGLIQKRHGTKKFQDFEFPSEVKFIDEFKVEGEKSKLIVSTSTELYIDNVKVCDVANTIEGVTFRNTYLFVDGECLRAYYKDESTGTWKIVTVTTPTNNEDSLSAKGVKGEYTIKVTTPNKFSVGQYIQIGEYSKDSTIAPLTARVLSVSGSTVTLGETVKTEYIKVNASTGEQTTEERETTQKTKLEFDYPSGTKISLFQNAVDYKYDGDLKTANGKRYYEPCVYELEDAYKGLNIIPTHPVHIAFHKDALYIVSKDYPSNIYISHQNNMYYFPVVKYASVPANGDEIVALVSFNDSLVIARKNDMHVLYGETNNPNNGMQFTLKKITTHTGCVSGKTAKVVHNYLFYLGSDGVVYKMCTTNTDVRLLTTQILSQRVNFLKKPFNFRIEDMSDANAVFTNNNYFLTIQNLTFVYSYRFMAWTVFDGIDSSYMYNQNEKVIWGNGRKLVTFDESSYLDEGKAFECYWHSKLFDLGTPTIYKYFKYISLVFDVYEEFDSTVDIIFEIDYEDVNTSYTFKNQISRWGKAEWGDRFANRNINKSTPVYVGRRGRLVKVKVHNGYKIEYTYNTVADMEKDMKKENTVCFVNSNNTHYIVKFDNELNRLYWKKLDEEQVNQPIKIYNVEIEYSLRGRH